MRRSDRFDVLGTNRFIRAVGVTPAELRRGATIKGHDAPGSVDRIVCHGRAHRNRVAADYDGDLCVRGPHPGGICSTTGASLAARPALRPGRPGTHPIRAKAR